MTTDTKTTDLSNLTHEQKGRLQEYLNELVAPHKERYAKPSVEYIDHDGIKFNRKKGARYLEYRWRGFYVAMCVPSILFVDYTDTTTAGDPKKKGSDEYFCEKDFRRVSPDEQPHELTTIDAIIVYVERVTQLYVDNPPAIEAIRKDLTEWENRYVKQK